MGTSQRRVAAGRALAGIAAVVAILAGFAFFSGATTQAQQPTPTRASPYINPDLGLPTFNPGVSPRSGCVFPQRNDQQQLSDPGTANRNVHVDACLFAGSTNDENRCTQSGWQVRGIAGDREFHARFNNTTTVGWQFVTFCYDPEANGCADTSVKALVAIYWGPN